MKRSVRVTISLIFLSMIVAAQDMAESANLWESFSPPKEEFSVKAPCSFRRDDSNQDWNVYNCASTEAHFFVTSNSDGASSQLETIKRLPGSSPVLQSKVIVNGFEGSKLTFLDSEGFSQTVLSIQSKNRFYIFHAVTQSQNGHAGLFFDSIRLDRTPTESRSKPSKPTTILSVVTRPTIDDCTRFVTANCANFLRKPNGDQVVNVEPGQTSPLKILSTMKPGYTGLAVLYSIEGGVNVRVTFLASGQIGAVTPYKRLPFGLTNNAISAARLISFKPKVVNGVALSVVKPVEYGFFIY